MTPVQLHKSSVIHLAIIFAIASSLASCAGDDAGRVKETRFLMGTIVEIEAPLAGGVSRDGIDEAIEKAFGEIERVEKVFSVFDPDSEISRVNRLKAGQALEVSGEMFGLIEKAVEWNRRTEGAFDITVKPLVDLWNTAKTTKRVPAELEIREVMSNTGSYGIILDKSKSAISFAKEGIRLDMGGIAKGYATDRAIKVLKEEGVGNAIVNSGGDMYCLGRRSERSLWKVGVQHPRKRERMIFNFELEDRAIDTSGDYEKFFILNGKRYSHIIDPRTGYPIGDGVVSATVIAADSTTADILATSLCILGEEGLKILDGSKDVEAVLIIKDGSALKVRATKGFSSQYGIVKEERL